MLSKLQTINHVFRVYSRMLSRLQEAIYSCTQRCDARSRGQHPVEDSSNLASLHS